MPVAKFDVRDPKALRDHAPNRHNQFVVKDYERVPGTYCIINVRTGLVAARPSGRRYWALDLADAEREAAKLNRRAVEKHICTVCRHKRYADEIVDGRCAGCRAKSS